MSLQPGSRLGVYEILGLLGAGGMGEVYRALDRSSAARVAIKILPEAFAATRAARALRAGSAHARGAQPPLDRGDLRRWRTTARGVSS